MGDGRGDCTGGFGGGDKFASPVMVALVATIHVFTPERSGGRCLVGRARRLRRKAWMVGTSPSMTGWEPRRRQFSSARTGGANCTRRNVHDNGVVISPRAMLKVVAGWGEGDVQLI